ncbi:mate-domain-containing protein [Zychaea mexicana]|uniref:mate-domain-containing protein n=1 Tax=Zychaea mexicana TaxID=64656 RepID=UPI0022FEE479|nr:mate-domain-containing protein [Zychaea mexicana]KAI9490464.1 mate-domain-containing protein [Zychaea mexicana]
MSSNPSLLPSNTTSPPISRTSNDKTPLLHRYSSIEDQNYYHATISNCHYAGHVVRDVEVQKQETDIQQPLSARAILQELKVLVQISNPVVLTYMLQYSLQTGSVLVVGRLGPEELAASVFAFMFATITGWLLGLGGSTALDTLGSQLWGASTGKINEERRLMMNILFQRACIVLNVCFIPVAILWYFVDPVLRLLGQDALLCQMVQSFLRYSIPGTPAYIGFEITKKYLQTQEVLPHASTLTLLVCSPLNMLITYLFVYEFDLGFIGAPIAASLTHWIMLFVLLGIMYVVGDGKTKQTKWGLLPIHRRAFEQWKPFLALAIPGVLSLGSEYAAFEVITVLVGLLDSSTTMAAQSIIVIADDILCTIPLGISVATTTRVGYWLGRGLPGHAKMASFVSILFALSVGAVAAIVLLVTKDSFGYLFSKDTTVVGLVGKVLPYLVIFQFVDGVAGASGGALRGAGCQHWSASANLIGYYAFALPLGAFLSFGSAHLGLLGLWAALCAGLFAIAAIQTIVLLRMNWQCQVELCTLRFKK